LDDEPFSSTEEINFSWTKLLRTLEMGGAVTGLVFGAIPLPDTLSKLVITSSGFPPALVSNAGDWLPCELIHLEFPMLQLHRNGSRSVPLFTPAQLMAYPRTLTQLRLFVTDDFEPWDSALVASIPPQMTYLILPLVYLRLVNYHAP
jgi:hypothetical protein